MLPITVRQSVVFLALRLVLLQILLSSLYLLVRFPFSLFNVSLSFKMIYFSLDMWFFIVIMSTEVYLTLEIVIRWLTEFYEVRNGEIVYRSGVLSHREKIYALKNIESITFFQDFWGRIFNYGTITLFNPFLNQRIHLDAIGNPSKYVKIIEGALPDTNHSGNILFIDQENKNI